MTRDLPKYVHRYRSRHGQERLYFRLGNGHPYTRIHEKPHSPEFWAVYAALLKGEAIVKTAIPEPIVKALPNTFRSLCDAYAKSDDFKKRDKAILDAICQQPIKASEPNTDPPAL
jgi:hypothetical protein